MNGLSTDRLATVENALAVEPAVGAYVWTSVVATGFLVVCVPLAIAASGLPAAVVLAAAGVCYFAAVFAAGRVFEGVASAVFVLSLFDISTTLVAGPGIATLDLVAVDLVAVPFLAALVSGWLAGGVSVRADARAVAVVAFAGFVCWAFAAGVVANGVSGTAGVMYAIEQLRYLVVFCVAALVVARANARCAIYPFVVAAVGNLGLSLAQIANGGMFGFFALGEPPDRYLRSFALGPFDVATGFYAGGFSGHGRELAMILLLCIPLAVAVAARRWRVGLLPAGVVVAASVLSIRVADTDAGWATLLISCTFFAVYLAATLVVRTKHRYSTVAAVSVAGVVSAVGVVLARYAWFVVRTSDSTIPVFRTSSLGIRLDEYVAAVRTALRYPLFGIGGDNFYLVSERLIGSPDLGVHNTFLSVLAATGFVGFACYLLAVLAVIWIALRLAVATTGDDRLLWVAVVFAMASFCAYSSWMSSYSWVAGNTAFWLLAGVVVGAAANGYYTVGGEPIE